MVIANIEVDNGRVEQEEAKGSGDVGVEGDGAEGRKMGGGGASSKEVGGEKNENP